MFLTVFHVVSCFAYPEVADLGCQLILFTDWNVVARIVGAKSVTGPIMVIIRYLTVMQCSLPHFVRWNCSVGDLKEIRLFDS